MAVKMQVLASREEWLNNRSRIGGSEASAVIGLNPYMSNVALYDLKTGATQREDISEKPFVKYGTEAERHLRELFKLDYPQYKLEYVDNNMWTNDEYPFAHASLDGWLTDEDGRRGIWECKTTNILNSMQRENWKDRLPINYYVQVLHYMLVTEFDFAIVKAQLKSEFGGEVRLETKHYRIDRADVEDDIKYLAEQEKKFWQQVQKRERPSLVLPGI